MLRLESGDVLFGRIEESDPDGVRFRRVDTEGVVELPWSLVDPTQRDALRLRFGYVESDGVEEMVDAEKLVLTDGTELFGIVVGRDDQYLWLKRAEGTIPVPRRSLAGASTPARVPALDVYTREELYQKKAQELAEGLAASGREGAEACAELARYAEEILDYAHALEYFGRAKDLDPSFEPQAIEAAIARTEEKAALQEQVDLLARIDLLRARKRYDLAVEALGTFPELYPDSPLLEDWNKLRDRVAKHQERDARAEITRSVYREATRLVRDAVKTKTNYEALVSYLDDGLVEAVLEATSKDLARIAPGITTDEVQRLWSERKGGRVHQSSYGNGTWLLGKARALATYEKEDEKKTEAPAAGSQAEARAKLEQRIERYLRNQELSRSANASAGSDEENPAKFWKEWDRAGRAQWAMAYFAEFSGLFRVEGVRFSNCRECGGKGFREIRFTGSAVAGSKAGDQLIPCPTCHTIGRVRRIRYR